MVLNRKLSWIKKIFKWIRFLASSWRIQIWMLKLDDAHIYMFGCDHQTFIPQRECTNNMWNIVIAVLVGKLWQEISNQWLRLRKTQSNNISNRIFFSTYQCNKQAIKRMGIKTQESKANVACTHVFKSVCIKA